MALSESNTLLFTGSNYSDGFCFCCCLPFTVVLFIETLVICMPIARYSKEEDCLRFNTCTTWSYRPGLRSKLLTQRSWSYPYV